MRRAQSLFLPVLLLALSVPQPARAYAIFTHQALIDLTWNDSIRPLLAARFPGITEAELNRAHGYAYGGCVIQDMGYYPFGKHIFSDLTHYVRSGDFVVALLREARNADEYAFAIGALSHYVGDSIGHSRAINPATGITFQNLAAKYGPDVTYEEDPIAHIRTEFGFDVAQIAWQRYAPGAYRRLVGFHVARALLDRAFYKTYGLSVRSVLGPQRSAIGSYHYSARHILPRFAKITVVNARGHLPQEIDDSWRRQFLSGISQTDYQRQWGNTHHRPGITAHILAFVVRIVPKIGILKVLSIKTPSPATEDLFFKSMSEAQDVFRRVLTRLSNDPPADLALANRDLDTGEHVKPGAYVLTDKTYAQLLGKITADGALPVPPGLREDILAYYSDPAAPISTKKNAKEWKKILAELAILKGRD